MRVALIIEAWSPWLGGGQTHAERLVRGLVERGYTVDVYTRRLIINSKPYSTDTRFAGARVYRLGRTSPINSPIGRISWIRDTTRIASRRRYDVIHGQANLGGLPAKLISRTTKTPCVYTVHGSGLMDWDELKRGPHGWVNREIERWLLTTIRYDLEISVDHRFTQLPNTNEVVVIPNGVDVDLFDSIPAEKNDRFTFLFVGRLHPQKGLRFLFEALEHMDRDFTVDIVGDGPLRSALEQHADDKRLPVRFLGRLSGDELIRAYKRAHVFVLPSVYEGQPITLLEAWAAGLPVIVTDVGDNDRFVTEENGWLVMPRSERALREAMHKAMSLSNDERSSIGETNRTKAREDYGWDRMVERTIEAYERVANTHKGAGPNSPP